MQLVCDLHIHSKYSRMTSPQMEPATIAAWARKKGVDVIATGDWTHPDWARTLRETLEPAEEGLFVLRGAASDDPRFILSAEIACTHPGRGGNARIRHVVLVPSLEEAEAVATQLSWIGNLRADGRPILSVHSEEFVRTVVSASERAIVFPSHAWVPNLSVLGSGGFDRIEDCYGAAVHRIFAMETGLSSDPAMNWRCSFLDRFTLVSNSDAHSPNTIGREATVLETAERSYDAVADALRRGSVVETVEFFPEEGRYHATGHARCKVVVSAEEAAGLEGQCPRCGGSLTVGVEGRLAALADRPQGFTKPKAPSFRRTLGLDVVVAQALGMGIETKAVMAEYDRLIGRLGSEFHILRDALMEEVAAVSLPHVAEALQRVRQGELAISPGYDGEFGSIRVFSDQERMALAPQQTLF